MPSSKKAPRNPNHPMKGSTMFLIHPLSQFIMWKVMESPIPFPRYNKTGYPNKPFKFEKLWLLLLGALLELQTRQFVKAN